MTDNSFFIKSFLPDILECITELYSHPEQGCLLQVPHFDHAPFTAAVDRRNVDPHASNRTGMLEIQLLVMLPRLKTPHWQHS